MRRLLLVRHGESIWNAEARIQGQRCEGLSERGWAQARTTAVALADAYPSALLVTSDLRRTRETTAPLEEALGTSARHEPRLRERDFGTWEGLLRDDVVRDDAERWGRWRAGEDVVMAEIGGETTEALRRRVEPVLRDLAVGTPDGAVTIAVTHGGPVWYGVQGLLGLTDGTLGAVANASVTEVVVRDDGRLALGRWNETAHLPVELRVESLISR